ncbi:MAG: alpha/beta hydrolase [Sedimentisphaerales bacterium]|nr:alpha/beta hydrolase [Sedimentisphaerales bacterium]
MKIHKKYRLAQIVVLLGIIMAQFSCGQRPSETKADKEPVTRKWVDINYAGDTLTGHLLDIYLPSQGEGPYPVIVTVAGSAWFSNNSKHWAYGLGEPLLKEGFAIVPANHRSSREAVFPAQINDIKGVVRFLHANAAKYDLDTTFIGITGNSSGGHLAAMMGTSGGVKNYTVGKKTLDIEGNVGGNSKESSRVDAVVDWYGPTTFLQMNSCGSSMEHNAPDSPESVLIGGPVQENRDLCALADPITYIDEKDPPFLIIHGDADPLVPHCQSVLLLEALTRKGVAGEMITVPGGGHGEGVWVDKYIEKMVTFFTEAKNDSSFKIKKR